MFEVQSFNNHPVVEVEFDGRLVHMSIKWTSPSFATTILEEEGEVEYSTPVTIGGKKGAFRMRVRKDDETLVCMFVVENEKQ